MVVDITPLDVYFTPPAIEYNISAQKIPQNTPHDYTLDVVDTFGEDFEKANPKLDAWDKGMIHNGE